MARFETLSENDLSNILEGKDSSNTKRVIKASLAILESYVISKGTDLPSIQATTVTELDTCFRSFYAEARKADGSRYAKKSMITLRYGLQKHFIKERDIDIINDKEFSKSNDMFKAVLVHLKKDGVGEHQQKAVMPPEDIEKLYEKVFSVDSPNALQKKTMFEYLFYFCNRGRENLRELQKTDFTIDTDSSGREYVSVRIQRQTKNHRGDDVHDADPNQGRMYDRPGKN